MELSPFGGRVAAFETSGRVIHALLRRARRDRSQQQRVDNSFPAAHAAARTCRCSNWIGERYPSAECRRRGLYHPSMKSNTFIFASA